MGTHKTCKICEETKIIDDFYKSQRGLKCKNCTLQITREYKKNKRKNLDFRKSEGIKQKERRVRLWQNTLIHDSKRGKDHTLTVSDINEMCEKNLLRMAVNPKGELVYTLSDGITKGLNHKEMELISLFTNIGGESKQKSRRTKK